MSIYHLIVLEVRFGWAWLCSLFRVSQGQNHAVGHAELLSGNSGEGFLSRLVQVGGQIHFLAVIELRFAFLCCWSFLASKDCHIEFLVCVFLLFSYSCPSFSPIVLPHPAALMCSKSDFFPLQLKNLPDLKRFIWVGQTRPDNPLCVKVNVSCSVT